MSLVKDKDLLKAEIVRNKSNKKRYEKLSSSLGFKDIKEMTDLAIREDNTDALMGVAKSNIHAAVAELSRPEHASYFRDKLKKDAGNFIPSLYFMSRSNAPLQFKVLLKRLTRTIILRKSLNISGRGSRGKARHTITYHPGMSEYDITRTLFNYFQRGNTLHFSDIVGVERRQKKRNVVLILDTSGSMFGKLLLNAALTTSVLSYAMKDDFSAVILFASRSYVLKNIKEPRKIVDLIDEILESEAVGFTNIEQALRKGLEQLKSNKTSAKSMGVLITDGDYNRGAHPSTISKLFPELHVINMPPENSKVAVIERGYQVCKETAAAGRGYYYPVSDFNEIPRALMELLSKI